MTGAVLSGTQVSADIKTKLQEQVREIQSKDASFKPGLVIVQVLNSINSIISISVVQTSEKQTIDMTHVMLTCYFHLHYIDRVISLFQFHELFTRLETGLTAMFILI